MNRSQWGESLRRRLRLRSAGGQPPSAPVRKRRVSRREREAKRQRQLYWGVSIAGALVVAILAIGLTREYIVKPREVLATVEGTKIRREDYWKVRSVDLINQVSQYSQFAQLLQGDQQQQYLALAQQAANELDGLWGSTDIDDATLNRMIEDQIFLKNMGDLGLSISDQDVKDYIDQQFEPTDAPIYTPTPSPTLIPTRAAWATGTAEANLTATAVATAGAVSTTPPAGTPLGSPEGTPAASPDTELAASPAASPESGSPAATPVPGDIGTPAASPNASPENAASPQGVASPESAASPEGAASPTAAASPEGSPAASPSADASPAVSPTPNQEQARQTAEAGYEEYQDAVFGRAHLSRADYERLIVRPTLARQKVRDKLVSENVGQTAEQVHAAHILVDTKDLADQIYQQVSQPGADFEQAARDQSTDTSTAANGGDLGWFSRGAMVKPFEDAAFSLQPGAIGQPVQSEFGWHIIKVYAHEPERPLTDDQISRLQDQVVQQWVDQQRQDMEISSDLDPTPTPPSETFSPPPDAPPLPTATPTSAASPEASPQASPVASPVASPESSAAASPETTVSASPDAPPPAPLETPPIASPQATPVASPEAPSAATREATSAVSTTASPAASPEATPTATSMASPVSSPAESPAASPQTRTPESGLPDPPLLTPTS